MSEEKYLLYLTAFVAEIFRPLPTMTATSSLSLANPLPRLALRLSYQCSSHHMNLNSGTRIIEW